MTDHIDIKSIIGLNSRTKGLLKEFAGNLIKGQGHHNLRKHLKVQHNERSDKHTFTWERWDNGDGNWDLVRAVCAYPGDFSSECLHAYWDALARDNEVEWYISLLNVLEGAFW